MHVLNHHGTLYCVPITATIEQVCCVPNPGLSTSHVNLSTAVQGGQCPYPVYGRGNRLSNNERT